MTKRRSRAASACSFRGVERRDVEEYCVSESWIRAAAGKALDRRGAPLVIKMTGASSPIFLRRPAKRPLKIQTDGLRLASGFRRAGARRLWTSLTAIGHSYSVRPRFLHGRARRVAIRTEHAAIARLGFDQRRAGAAFVDILAGVGRHRFGALVTADGTGDRRNECHSGHGRPQSLARRERRRFKRLPTLFCAKPSRFSKRSARARCEFERAIDDAV